MVSLNIYWGNICACFCLTTCLKRNKVVGGGLGITLPIWVLEQDPSLFRLRCSGCLLWSALLRAKPLWHCVCFSIACWTFPIFLLNPGFYLFQHCLFYNKMPINTQFIFLMWSIKCFPALKNTQIQTFQIKERPIEMGSSASEQPQILFIGKKKGQTVF